MKTTIVRMLRFGSGYKVKLECGHAYWATLDEAQRDQLWIGKPVTCVAWHAKGR